MGWEIDPTGLYDFLTRVARDYPGVPLYVTENGAAFADEKAPDGQVHDPARVDYLDAHFRAAQRAIADGVDLRGYFVWSLLDNFEWAYGYSKRFGLIHVDYETLERTPEGQRPLVRPGHAGERLAGVVSTRSGPANRALPVSRSVPRARMSVAGSADRTSMSPGSTIRRRSAPVNAVRSACRRTSLARRSPGSSVDAEEAGELDHRAGDARAPGPRGRAGRPRRRRGRRRWHTHDTSTSPSVAISSALRAKPAYSNVV